MSNSAKINAFLHYFCYIVTTILHFYYFLLFKIDLIFIFFYINFINSANVTFCAKERGFIMLIKCKLFFRKCERKSFNGSEFLQCTFLDENDLLYRFNFPVIKENEKYLSMHKDTLCDLDLLLYPPIDKTKARYSLMGV